MLRDLLEQFVFADCQLGQHPIVNAGVFLRDKEDVKLLIRIHPDPSYDVTVPESVRASREQLKYPRGSVNTLLTFSAVDDPDPSKRLYRSVLTVPLLSGSEVQGALSFDAQEQEYFGDRHTSSAWLLAALVAYILGAPRGRRPNRTQESERLGKALRDIRKELGITQEQLAPQIGTSRIALSSWETGAQAPSPGVLARWCMALGLLAPRAEAVVKVLDLPTGLLKALSQDPRVVHQLSSEQFECLIAERLDAMDFDVTLTGGTTLRDGGIDLIAVPKLRTVGTVLLGGQIKHHQEKRKTGREAVDRLLAWRDTAFHLGLLVTNTTFTKDAKWLAEQARNQAFLRLRDFVDIKRWIAGKFWQEEEWRELPDTIQLAPGIIVPVPKPSLRTVSDLWPFTAIKKHENR